MWLHDQSQTIKRTDFTRISFNLYQFMISLSTLHFIPLQIIGLILRYRLFLFEEKKKQVSRPFFIV